MRPIAKYPRTQHIEGSRLQMGDGDLAQVALSELAGQHLVIEEKLDGANAAVSFDADGELFLQSRGHYLLGGPRERHFDLFKAWARCHAKALFERLGDRYVMYGEWLYARHTIFYDALPHYFAEFDLLDTREGCFLSTPERRRVLAGAPVFSVPVLAQGTLDEVGDLQSLVGVSLYKTARWPIHLRVQATEAGVDPERTWSEGDPSDEAEGLYIKAERDGRVEGRFKFVRASFLMAVHDSETHWLSRPIVPNQLADGVDIFSPTLAGDPAP